MTDTRSKLVLYKNISRYLAELRRLVTKEVGPEDLLSVKETEAVRERAKAIRRVPSWKDEITFADKTGLGVRDLLCRLGELNPRPVYVWTPLSNVCGVLRPVPLREFNIKFDFAATIEGIVSLVTEDLEDQMIFDFSEDRNGERVVEIEVSGTHWGPSRLRL